MSGTIIFPDLEVDVLLTEYLPATVCAQPANISRFSAFWFQATFASRFSFTASDGVRFQSAHILPQVFTVSKGEVMLRSIFSVAIFSSFGQSYGSAVGSF